MANGSLIGTESLSTEPKRTQVYMATHDGAGNRLPLMERSFISFTYGGRRIEDFSLIATLDDRLNKNMYAEFEDSTTDYTTIDGQYYWGTRMQANSLTFTLATDYLLEPVLEDFKHWFRPGVERALILAEHPNRQILARVAEPPTLNVVPFGEQIEMTTIDANGEPQVYKTMTTVYKGTVSLNFMMDEPYWSGILNYMPYNAITSGTADTTGLDDETIALVNEFITENSLTSQDALKICVEDQIPHDLSLYTDNNYSLGISNPYTDALGARIDTAKIDDPETARIGYAIDNNNSVDLNSESQYYLFYSGSAPSKPILTFTLELKFNNDGYITNPINSIGAPDATEQSYIKVGEHYFYFTTPGICTMYNKALQLIDEMEDTATVYELRKEFRDKIRDKYARAWVLDCIKNYELTTSISGIRSEVRSKIKKFFVASTRTNIKLVNNSVIREIETYCNADFYFDSKTGDAKGTFTCLTTKEPVDGEKVTENVGDMVLSSYLIIDERNHLSEEGRVIAGGDNNNCTEITTNETLTNFNISFKNMYY